MQAEAHPPVVPPGFPAALRATDASPSGLTFFGLAGIRQSDASGIALEEQKALGGQVAGVVHGASVVRHHTTRHELLDELSGDKADSNATPGLQPTLDGA
jgi:hypothetical protein